MAIATLIRGDEVRGVESRRSYHVSRIDGGKVWLRLVRPAGLRGGVIAVEDLGAFDAARFHRDERRTDGFYVVTRRS